MTLMELAVLIVIVACTCSARRNFAMPDPIGSNRGASSAGGQQSHSAALRPIVYRIEEDCEPGTIVGDLRRDGDFELRFPGAGRTVFDQLRFVLLTRDDGMAAGGSTVQASDDDGNPNRHFSLDPISGVIRAVTTLDRDRICPEAETCFLDVDVAVQPAKYFRIIKVSKSINQGCYWTVVRHILTLRVI